jgi:N-acetylneuraminic acid mutarotase
MVRYKMVGRDVNSSPLQFRTWIVDDTPDYVQERYTGFKSGPDPLVDVSGYVIYDDSVIANFNLPLPTSWKTTLRVLPKCIPYSHFAIIGDFAYLFGGQITDKIYRASLDRPADWEDTGAVLPTPLYGGQLAIINDVIYLFGGNNGEGTDTIFSAPVSDPLNWTNHGSLLPRHIQISQLGIVDGYVYLFGGLEINHATSRIFRASTDAPLIWEDTGADLPFAMYNSQIAIIENKIYLYGGQQFATTVLDTIFVASTSDPLAWTISDYYLPYSMCGGQFFTVGNKGYMITPVAPGRVGLEFITGVPINNGFARILQCDLVTPDRWMDTLRQVPGEISQSQIGIIYDRLFLFGGSGSTVIFANNYEVKYKFGSEAVVTYADITRTQYHETPNKLDLFRVLGFPPWKTDYGS